MGKTVCHPKRVKKCAFCKRWNGDADLEIKNPASGIYFTMGVYGKCMVRNASRVSNAGDNCKEYEPSVEASRLL